MLILVMLHIVTLFDHIPNSSIMLADVEEKAFECADYHLVIFILVPLH